MKNFLINAIETALNAYLNNDSRATTEAANMAGKTISVELLPVNLIFNCHFTDKGVRVSTHQDELPAAKIKGTPLQLLCVIVAKEKRHQFFADDLTIEGDAEFAQQVVNLFDNITIDWENHSSRIIGDVPTYQITKLAGNLKEWLHKNKNDFTADINDYLHEEAEWFPHKEQLQEFFSEIDNLRMDTDRLASRISHIKSEIDKEDTP